MNQDYGMDFEVLSGIECMQIVADRAFSKKSMMTSGADSVTVVYVARKDGATAQAWEIPPTRLSNKNDVDFAFMNAKSFTLGFSHNDSTAVLSLTFGGIAK